jgi:hypothetical protein
MPSSIVILSEVPACRDEVEGPAFVFGAMLPPEKRNFRMAGDSSVRKTRSISLKTLE